MDMGVIARGVMDEQAQRNLWIILWMLGIWMERDFLVEVVTLLLWGTFIK